MQAQTYFKDRRNIYVCDACNGHIVTVDLEEGVTPFMLPCMCKEGCKGLMQSSMYRVFDQRMAASHEWYRPAEAEIAALSPGYRDHVKNGGLLIRKVT